MINGIVSIQIGGCGIKIGKLFWKTLQDEHSENKQSPMLELLLKKNVYFEEIAERSYSPRTVFMDLDPCGLDEVRMDFGANHLVQGKGSMHYNFGRAWSEDGPHYIETLLNTIKKKAEACDRFQGFQIIYGAGGGTGAAVSSLLMEALRNEYPDNLLLAFPVIPDSRRMDSELERYNTILALHQAYSHAHAVNIIDNYALSDICFRTRKIVKTSYFHYNNIANRVVSGVSSFFRSPSVATISDLRKYCNTLIPYPSMNFLSTHIAPLFSPYIPFRQPTSQDIFLQMHDSKTSVIPVDPRHGRFLVGCALFRGSISKTEMIMEVFRMFNKSIVLY